jgi:hypothetical protein
MLQRDIIGLDADAADESRTATDHVPGPRRSRRSQALPLFRCSRCRSRSAYSLRRTGSSVVARADRSILTESAERRPSLIVLEDLHWADAATIDFSLLLTSCRRESCC